MAPGWEKHNSYMWDATRQVGEWLVEHVEPQPGQTILDIAAGPGNSGFAAAAVVGDSGRVISTDFAEAMVTAAEHTAKQLGVTNVEFKTMDAEKMDLADDSVDGIICRWGFMLMLDPDAALRETRRVLRPGGKLAFSVWGGPAQNPWVTLMGMVLTQRGTPPQNDPFGPGGMFSMADHDKIRTMVTDAGYENVAIEEMPLAWTFDDFDDFWSFQTELAGAIAALVAELDPSEVETLKGEVKTALEPFRSGDGYSLPAVTTNVEAS
jgi:SAM-dependent methyltransferase